MRISDLQEKDVITINGKRIGKIIDIDIDDDGKIVYFIVEIPNMFRSMFLSFKENKILFHNIKKIGDDVILVQIDENVV